MTSLMAVFVLYPVAMVALISSNLGFISMGLGRITQALGLEPPTNHGFW